MKIAARNSASFIASPTQASGVLLYGPDRGQIRQSADKIAGAILKDIHDPFNRADLSVETIHDDPTSLPDELAAMSFTGERRLIVVRDATDKLTALFKEHLPLINDQNYLLVMAGELGPRSSLRALFESESALAALPCYLDEGAGLAQLIRQTLQDSGLRVEREVVDYLCHQLGGDRQIILSELTKIALYFDSETTVDIAALRQLVAEGTEQSMDDLCQAVASGQCARASQLLDQLFLQGTASVAILRSLHRHFARLQEIHHHKATGKSTEQAVKSLRPPVFFKQQPLLQRAADQWPLKRASHALHLLMEAERDSKRGGSLDQLVCSHALLRIARAAGR